MNSLYHRPTAHPAYSYAPGSMDPGGRPGSMDLGDRPGSMDLGGRTEPADDRTELAGDRTEPEGDRPEPGDRPGQGGKPVLDVTAQAGSSSGPLPQRKLTTILKRKAMYCSHAYNTSSSTSGQPNAVLMSTKSTILTRPEVESCCESKINHAGNKCPAKVPLFERIGRQRPAFLFTLILLLKPNHQRLEVFDDGRGVGFVGSGHGLERFRPGLGCT